MTSLYTIHAKVWRWPGEGGWHFVSLDKKISAKIKDEHGKNFYGSGFLKIVATVGKNNWQTALFPYTKENIYLISIKKQIRNKEGIMEGDKVKITFKFI